MHIPCFRHPQPITGLSATASSLSYSLLSLFSLIFPPLLALHPFPPIPPVPSYVLLVIGSWAQISLHSQMDLELAVVRGRASLLRLRLGRIQIRRCRRELLDFFLIWFVNSLDPDTRWCVIDSLGIYEPFPHERGITTGYMPGP